MNKIFLFIFFALIPYFVFAFSSQNYATGNASTTSTKILDPLYQRSYLLIINKGADSILVKIGEAHTASEGVLIPAGGNWEPMQIPKGSVWLKSSSGTPAYSIVEGVSL